MAEVVRVRAIKKKYNGKLILDIDEFDLFSGEIVTISGLNGAGKSTLLKVIGLLEKPDKGSGFLEIFGQRPALKNRLKLRRKLVVVSQTPFMFRKNVFNNIALGLKWRKLDKKEIEKRVLETADFFEIDYLEQSANTLSRGQMQRVAFARALALKSDVFLLDEPLNALDTGIKDRLLSKLKEVLTKEGRSAIYVSHSREDVNLISDRQLVLREGRFIS